MQMACRCYRNIWSRGRKLRAERMLRMVRTEKQAAYVLGPGVQCANRVWQIASGVELFAAVRDAASRQRRSTANLAKCKSLRATCNDFAWYQNSHYAASHSIDASWQNTVFLARILLSALPNLMRAPRRASGKE